VHPHTVAWPSLARRCCRSNLDVRSRYPPVPAPRPRSRHLVRTEVRPLRHARDSCPWTTCRPLPAHPPRRSAPSRPAVPDLPALRPPRSPALPRPNRSPSAPPPAPADLLHLPPLASPRPNRSPFVAPSAPAGIPCRRSRRAARAEARLSRRLRRPVRQPLLAPCRPGRNPYDPPSASDDLTCRRSRRPARTGVRSLRRPRRPAFQPPPPLAPCLGDRSPRARRLRPLVVRPRPPLAPPRPGRNPSAAPSATAASSDDDRTASLAPAMPKHAVRSFRRPPASPGTSTAAACPPPGPKPVRLPGAACGTLEWRSGSRHLGSTQFVPRLLAGLRPPASRPRRPVADFPSAPKRLCSTGRGLRTLGRPVGRPVRCVAPKRAASLGPSVHLPLMLLAATASSLARPCGPPCAGSRPLRSLSRPAAFLRLPRCTRRCLAASVGVRASAFRPHRLVSAAAFVPKHVRCAGRHRRATGRRSAALARPAAPKCVVAFGGRLPPVIIEPRPSARFCPRASPPAVALEPPGPSGDLATLRRPSPRPKMRLVPSR
jgi:hypothetical protein